MGHCVIAVSYTHLDVYKRQGNTTPAVEFKNVSFTYAGGGDHAVENISFKAMPGQTIGIIGGTGSGKSTLVNLIPRFYDVSEGEVDIAGKNIQDYTYGLSLIHIF